MSPPLPMSALVRPVDNYVLQSSQRRPRRGTSAVFAALEFRAQFIFRLIDDLGSASSHDREYEKRGLECDRVLFDHGIGRQPSVYRSGGAVGEQVGERKNRLSGESLYRRGLPADVRVPPGPARHHESFAGSGRFALQNLYRSEGPVPWPRFDG